MLALLWAASAISASAFSSNFRGSQNQRSAQLAQMQPQAVAKTLSKVQDTWLAQAYAFAGCDSKSSACGQASDAFSGSCKKVGNAVFTAGNGNADDVREYMTAVCSNSPGHKRDACYGVSAALLKQMSPVGYQNREAADKNVGKACSFLWKKYVDAQVTKKAQERKNEEAEEAKEAEAAAEEAKSEKAKAEKEKKAKEETDKQEKAKAVEEAKESQERLAEAKASIGKSLDEEKAKIQKVEKEADETIEEADEIKKE